jgi:class 3 adenylate cyclase
MEQKDYRLAAIMYTDIMGFSRMMEKDEAGTLELLRYHNDLIGGIVADHHGTVIKTIGDALLVDFKNTVEAMQSAMEIQDKLYVHNKENPGLPLLVRIGVHLGDIYFFENDALGEGINIAARLQSLASPGCICFSQDVYNLVLNKIEFRAEKLGKVSLKNITKEIHAYEITTPNVEFDPNHDKPRPGFKPGSYLDGGSGAVEEEDESVGTMALSHAPKRNPMVPPLAEEAGATPLGALVTPSAPSTRPAPMAASPGSDTSGAAAPGAAAQGAGMAGAGRADMGKAAPDRSYSPEGSRQILDEIRKAILSDIKNEGRRLTVNEALARYASYGVEAEEVIASMAESGLLVRDGKAPGSSAAAGRDGAFTGPGSDFDPEALGRNIEAAVTGIVGEIQRNVERGMSYRSEGRYRADRDRYREKYDHHREKYERKLDRNEERADIRDDDLPTGKWDRKLAENETWNPRHEETSSNIESYRGQLRSRLRHQRGGFIGNLTSYLAVNAGFWYLYLGPLIQYRQFLWAPIISAAWGIGLVSSAVAARRGAAKVREAEAMPDLDEGQLQTYKKLNRVKDSIAMHAASTITVPILLGILNFCYPEGKEFLWFLIPTVAMVLSFFSHLSSFATSKSKLQRELLSSLGIEDGWRGIFRHRKAQAAVSSELGPFASVYREAEKAKTDIVAELKSGNPLDEDLEPSLEGFVSQVRLLAQSANEIDRIVGAIPMGDLAADKAELVRKSEAASSASLKDEYKRSIDEIEKQEQSYDELKNQSEVIKLRLSSAVNQLKQMRIDVARLKAAGDESGGSGGVVELKRRTDELATYLQDLRKGYDEGAAAGSDPFAELEALAKANDEKKRIGDAGESGKA